MTVHLESNSQIQQTNANAMQENRVQVQPSKEALGDVRPSSKLSKASRILFCILTLGISEGIRFFVNKFSSKSPAPSRIDREPQVRNAPRIGSETQVNIAPRTEDEPQSINIGELFKTGAKIPANFIQAGKEALQEIYSKFGVTGKTDKDLEDMVKSKISEKKTLELGQVKELFESQKTIIFLESANQTLMSKVPNFRKNTGSPAKTISAALIRDDENLRARLQNCSNKTDFEALVEDLADRLKSIETKATAIRADYDAAIQNHAKIFAEQSGIDLESILTNLKENPKLFFEKNLNRNVVDFAKENFSVADAKERMLAILQNTFKDFEASLKKIQSWNLPDDPTYESIVLSDVCRNFEIKGDMAELLGNIAKDERLCPKNLVERLLNASSQDDFNRIVQDAIATMGPILDQHIADAFKKSVVIGADDFSRIGNVLKARLMPTYNDANLGPAQYSLLKDHMDAFVRNMEATNSTASVQATLSAVILTYADRAVYTRENITKGLETLIAQKSGIPLKGMQFNRFQAKAEIILENRSTNAAQKREALQSLAEQYAQNQANVLQTIQNMPLTSAMKARLNEAVRHLGACDSDLFTNALQHFIIQYATSGSKTKATEANLIKLMNQLDADYAQFVKKHLNGTEPTLPDMIFLKECALSMLAENQKISTSFAQRIDELGRTMADRYDVDNSAYQNALSYLNILKKPTA